MDTVVDIAKVRQGKIKEISLYKLDNIAKSLVEENIDSLISSIKKMPQIPAEAIVENYSCAIISQIAERYSKEELLNMIKKGYIFDLKYSLDDGFYSKL